MEKKFKVTRRHSFGSIVMFLLCLVLSATFIVSLFVTPWLVFKLGNGNYGQLIGLDFFFRISDRFLGTHLNRQSYIMFNEYFHTTAYMFAGGGTIVLLYNIFSLIIPALYILSIIWILYFFFTAFVYLFSGRIASGGIPLAMTITHILLTALTSGSAIGIALFTNNLETRLQNAGYEKISYSSFDITWPIVMICIPVVCLVIMIFVKGITYGRHRIWCEDAELGNYVTKDGKIYYPAPLAPGAAYGFGAAMPSSVNVNINKEGDGKYIPTEASVTKINYKTATGLPYTMASIGGHAFSGNQNLVTAIVPEGIDKLGEGAFANCGSLRIVSIPKSVKDIGMNCFFNCANIQRINYSGTKEQWRHIRRHSNWLYKAGTSVVVCTDGSILVNPVR